jgi:tetratricopeptide (TPR) repeat protein
VATVAEAFSLAWQHFKAGNAMQAEQLCQQILQANPGHAEAQHLIGIIAYQSGRYEVAVAAFRQAVALSPGAAGCYSNLGLAQDALGQHEAAVASYRQAIHLQPDLAVVHSNLGNSLRLLGNRQEAEHHCRRALELSPNYAEAHCNFGVVLADNGKVEEALDHFRLAVQLNPQYAEAHYNLGSALLKQGNLEEAIFHCQEALRVRPGFAQAHNNLGTARLSQGRHDESLHHYQRALQLMPEFAESHYNLANALHNRGFIDDAISHWQSALRLRGNYPEANYNLGNGLLVKGKVEEAIAHYQEALRQRPDYAEAHCNLGNALESQGKLEEAMPHWHQALKIEPGLAEAHNNLANALLRVGRRDEALQHSEVALRLNANFPAAWTTLGNIRQHLCQFEEALACYEKALRIDPRHGETHLNRALLWLLEAKWEKGWLEFEWRWETKGFTRYTFSQPLWDGSPLASRTLLVPGEQGLGDTLQFIRFVQWLRQRGKRVIAVCQPALWPLLAKSLGQKDLVAAGAPLPAFDVYAPLFSLPRILKTTDSTVPADIPYLTSGVRCPVSGVKTIPSSHTGLRTPHSGPILDTGRRTPDAGRCLRIGISWQGSLTYGYDRQRSVPLTEFAAIADVAGVQLVSLQKGPGTEQLKALDDGAIQVLDLGSCLDEESGAFVDTAAVMQHLDLVISSDTAIAHLAGALGVPVWVVLPLVPDWRWLLHREDSRWYPSMRLFRQTQYCEWTDVFRRIVEELRSVVKEMYC